MKRICTADWQLADGNRDRYRIDFVRQRLPQIIKKYQPDQLLVLGDITESKDQHPASLVNEVVGCIYDLSQLCHVIILRGNHEYISIENPFFEFVNRFDNVKWINKPEEWAGSLFLPHTRNYKQDWKDTDFNGYDYIFAHNIFAGVNPVNGHSLGGIPPSIFPKDAIVISGDVHEPQSFDCITYVGAPFTVDFGDNYQPRLLLLDDDRRVSIKVGGQQKRLVNVYWPDKFEHNAHPNDIVKIQVHLEMQHVAKWAEIRAEVESWAKEQSLIVNVISPIVAYVKGDRKAVTKHESKTDEQYIDSYASRLGIDKDTLSTGKKMLAELN
jgi:Calcineurin-like phosphoesterase